MIHFGKNFRRILTVTAVAAMLVGTAAAASNITTRTIEANYRDIKVVVDGVQVELKDASGNSVEPFISDGTTYLPLRVIGEALGKEVTWDGTTSTVYVGKVPDTEDNWMTKLPPYQLQKTVAYDGSDRRASFDVAGVTHTIGMVFSPVMYSDDAFALWNTNSKYKTMTFTIGHMGDKTNDVKLEVYLDGEYSTEYEFKYDAAPKTVTVPLNYAPNVKLLFTKVTSNGNKTGDWGMYDISFS